MKRVTLPQPPNSEDLVYKSNPLAFNRAMSDWARRVKGAIEDASRVNDVPLGQQFQIGSFSTNTAINGTSTLGDVANFVCSLVTALIAKGVISQTVTRTGG